jgi:hypothetical protein
LKQVTNDFLPGKAGVSIGTPTAAEKRARDIEPAARRRGDQPFHDVGVDAGELAQRNSHRHELFEVDG